jgi:glucose/arabinose dehydrogenase
MTASLHPTAERAPARCLRRPFGGLVLLWVALLSACGGSTGEGTATPEARGQQLFAATGVNCVQCHADPASLRRDAPDAATLAGRIAGAIATNTGRMGEATYGYANLGAGQVMDLARYLYSLPVPDAGDPGPSPLPPETPPPAIPATQCQASTSADVRTELFSSGLSSPWAMAFLPDGRLLVTQKAGSVVLVSADGQSRVPVPWAAPGPLISDGGQGGLLDLALDPEFPVQPWVYFTYQEPGPASTSGTAVGRARFQNGVLSDFQRLYQQTPKGQGGIHFGARLAFGADRSLFVSLGDRGQDDPSRPTRNHAQHLGNTLGKVIRIRRDGTVPADNPFVGQPGALPEVWSLGHRNPQGLTIDAQTGILWSSEHGPQGGDEINRVYRGGNYAWPLRSYGCPYGAPQGTACRVGGGVHLPLDGTTFVEPLTFWAPGSMAPSNLIVYRGGGFPEWQGQLIVGALAGQQLWRVRLEGGVFASCDVISMNRRIRDVREGPDGWVWVLTDNGEIRRVLR